MNDVDVVKEGIIIIEKDYQQYKKRMCKEDDYFTLKELKDLYNYAKITLNIEKEF